MYFIFPRFDESIFLTETIETGNTKTSTFKKGKVFKTQIEFCQNRQPVGMVILPPMVIPMVKLSKYIILS